MGPEGLSLFSQELTTTHTLGKMNIVHMVHIVNILTSTYAKITQTVSSFPFPQVKFHMYFPSLLCTHLILDLITLIIFSKEYKL